jgi:hypothetical protein
VPAVEIICLLGKVRGLTAEVDVDVSEAENNSSKWIFDVEQDTSLVQRFDLQLLDNAGHVKQRAWFSPTITSICREAAGARIHIPEPDAPTITLSCDDVKTTIKYRVTIDAVHSGAR